MLYLILSILVFLIPTIICYFFYLYNDYRLKQIRFELDIKKETSKNLETIFYKILDIEKINNNDKDK